MTTFRFNRLVRCAALLTVVSTLQSATLQGQAVRSVLHEHLDHTRLSVRRDSFVVLVQGAPRGWQVLAAEREGADWLLVDAVTIEGMVSQSSTVRVDAQLNELSLRQQGTMMGKPMRIALDVTDDRVRGTALTPTNPDGELTIDVPHQPGLLDDNAVTSLLPAVRWQDGLQVTFPVLASGKGTISPFILRALGRETVSVPAGQFETWRVELQMDRARVIANVTTEAPYRVVRISNGPAFEMQLVR